MSQECGICGDDLSGQEREKFGDWEFGADSQRPWAPAVQVRLRILGCPKENMSTLISKPIHELDTSSNPTNLVGANIRVL